MLLNQRRIHSTTLLRLQAQFLPRLQSASEEQKKQIQQELDTAQKPDREEIEKIDARLREWDAEAQRQNPAYAAMVAPPALTLPDVQTALDPGTLLLCYAVREKACHLFVVSRTSF